LQARLGVDLGDDGLLAGQTGQRDALPGRTVLHFGEDQRLGLEHVEEHHGHYDAEKHKHDLEQ